MIETLYKGEFNLFGETYTLYTHAKDKATAKKNFEHQLAKKLNNSLHYIKFQFNGEKDNYFISKIKEKENGN